jgi:hypothetical protein
VLRFIDILIYYIKDNKKQITMCSFYSLSPTRLSRNMTMNRDRYCLSFASIQVHLRLWLGPCCSYSSFSVFFVFCCMSLFCVLCEMLPVSLDCLFLIIQSVFSDIVLFRDLCLMLPVFLDCSFVTVHSVFSNIYFLVE